MSGKGREVRDNVVPINRVLLHTERPYVGPASAMPFVKWAGGKRTLIPAIAKHFPDEVTTYWEPFVGGGAVFFTFAKRIERAMLGDTNEDLAITYRMVKDNVEALVERLGEHERAHRRRDGKQYKDGKTYYYRVRDEEPKEPIDVAARFIYLNKTCFNGLYRVNKQGQFNVPEGTYANPDICNAERLRKASAALQRAHIVLGDFGKTQPGAGDFIYCDPPYDGCFTGYQAAGFDGDAQKRLRDCANGWRQAGATVVLSNADTPEMRKLYADYRIEEAQAPRNINAKVGGRGKTGELIIIGDADG